MVFLCWQKMIKTDYFFWASVSVPVAQIIGVWTDRDSLWSSAGFRFKRFAVFFDLGDKIKLFLWSYVGFSCEEIFAVCFSLMEKSNYFFFDLPLVLIAKRFAIRSSSVTKSPRIWDRSPGGEVVRSITNLRKSKLKSSGAIVCLCF